MVDGEFTHPGGPSRQRVPVRDRARRTGLRLSGYPRRTLCAANPAASSTPHRWRFAKLVRVVFCSRCANADAVSSPMSLFERGRLDAVAGSWPGCGRAKRLSQRSVPSSPNRAYRMPRCSRYSTAARIWPAPHVVQSSPSGNPGTPAARPTATSWTPDVASPGARTGPGAAESGRPRKARSRTNIVPGKLAGGPATNVADVARGQPAPPA